MSNVYVEKSKIDILANAIAAKSGEPVTMTLAEMVSAVDGIETGGGITPTGNIDITQAGVTDVTDYATATVPSAGTVAATVFVNDLTLYVNNDSGVVSAYKTGTGGYIEANNSGWVSVDEYGDIPSASVTYEMAGSQALSTQAATAITPTESSQTAVAKGKFTTGAVTVNAIPSNYVGSGITQRTSPDLSASGATVTAPSGYYASAATKTISSGTATPAASISGTSATVSAGTNTLTLTKTVSNTPQVSAGYVSAGTAGNSNVSLTANVTTKAAATITPTTSNQTIASGTYLTGTQTISGDANLVAGNIKNGTTIFGVTGTYSGGGTLTVATKTATLSAVGQTLSFTGLSGTPKYWFVKTTSQISSSGSTTIYYITDGFWDGTSVKGNSFRIGSTRRIYSWTSGVSQSYSGGTLTITGGSGTGSSPGQFYGGNYELTYVY